MMENEADLEGTSFAGRFCQLQSGGCAEEENVMDSWTVVDFSEDTVPEPETPEMPEADAPKTKVLHLTDIHMDVSYTVGNEAVNCGSVSVCCTNDTFVAESEETAARYWGEYTCGTPRWTFQVRIINSTVCMYCPGSSLLY